MKYKISAKELDKLGLLKEVLERFRFQYPSIEVDENATITMTEEATIELRLSKDDKGNWITI